MSDEADRARDGGAGPDDTLPEVIVIGEGRVDGEVLARRDPRARAGGQREAPFESRAGAAVPDEAGGAIGAPLYDVVAVLLAHVIAVDAKTMKE